MDWTDKLQQKKKLRKMAGRMLWADVKDMMCSWKGILVACMYLCFFLLPYLNNAERLNIGAMFYFVMWVIGALSALSETSFNYLPLSTKGIVYYLKCRTNLIIAWMTAISVGTGAVLYALGAEIFLERGLGVLVFLLITVEWLFFMTLYGYSKPLGINFLDPDIPTARKVRIAIYNIYSVVMMVMGMFMWMFMDFDENNQKKLLFAVCAYLIMFIFRADAARWVRFNEFSKGVNRNLYNTQQAQQNQQA